MQNKCKLRGKLKFIIDGNLRKKKGNKIEQLYS
jgi:hypothetical protein